MKVRNLGLLVYPRNYKKKSYITDQRAPLGSLTFTIWQGLMWYIYIYIYILITNNNFIEMKYKNDEKLKTTNEKKKSIRWFAKNKTN